MKAHKTKSNTNKNIYMLWSGFGLLAIANSFALFTDWFWAISLDGTEFFRSLAESAYCGELKTCQVLENPAFLKSFSPTLLLVKV